jgi:hypothetical protein
MELEQLRETLAANAARLRHLVQGVGPGEAHWKPDEETWSIVEVINHLYDEERFDFRVRLEIILYHPEEKWPPIDPQGWVKARGYNERPLAPSLENFLTEREASLVWLASLPAPAWEMVYEAPFGPIRAGDMAASWVAHDLLHMRQLVELLHAATLRATAPYDTRYAGEW